MVRATLMGGIVVSLMLVFATGVANAELNASFGYNRNGLTLQFYDTSTSNNSRIISWHWEFGDGKWSDERSIIHTYEEYGVYNVSLTVVDLIGQKRTTSMPVYVDQTLEIMAAILLFVIMALTIVYVSIRRR